jgi:hypothetical protein
MTPTGVGPENLDQGMRARGGRDELDIEVSPKV